MLFPVQRVNASGVSRTSTTKSGFFSELESESRNKKFAGSESVFGIEKVDSAQVSSRSSREYEENI